MSGREEGIFLLITALVGKFTHFPLVWMLNVNVVTSEGVHYL